MLKDIINDHVVLAQQGNLESINFIYNNYKNLVNKISYKFLKDGVEIEDLQQEGYLGINKALEKFNIDKNVSFTTYVYNWILNHIAEYARQQSKTVRIPNHLIHSNKKLIKFKEEYWEKNKKWPSTQEICKKLNLTMAKLNNIHSMSGGTLSLDEQIGSDGGVLLDIIPDKDNSIENKYIKLFDILSEEDREILEKNSGVCGPMVSYKSLAKQYGKSFQHIKSGLDRSKRQIKRELKKLKYV